MVAGVLDLVVVVGKVPDADPDRLAAADPTREHDHVSFRALYPTRRLRYELFLPDRLDAEPIGLHVSRSGVRLPELEEWVRLQDGFSIEHTRVKRVTGTQMVLDVADPPLGVRFELCWLPPSNRSRK